jgi:ligand-binding sensor domain-containing protein
LAGDNVYCVTQDSKGYIWFGTETGVSRYDGQDFENFYISDGLGDNEIFRIDEDSQGRIWFSSFNHKISFFKDGKFYNSSNYEPFKDADVLSHYTNWIEDSRGNIWFTTTREIYAFDTENNVILSRGENSELTALHGFEIENDKVKAFNLRGYQVTMELANGEIDYEVTPLISKKTLEIYPKYIREGDPYLTQFGYELANNLFDSLTFSRRYLKQGISKIRRYGEDWFFCTYEGLILSDAARNISEWYPDKMVTDFMIDREGGNWLTTLGDGVFYAPSLNHLSITTYAGRSIGMITAFTEDEKGNIWFAGAGGSHGRVSNSEVKMLMEDVIPGRGMSKNMLQGPLENSFVIAAESDLLFVQNFQVLDRLRMAIKTVKKTKDDGYILGGRGFLYKMSQQELVQAFRSFRELGQSEILREFPRRYVSTGYVFDLEEDSTGMLAGTASGLYRLNEKNQLNELLSIPHPHERINDLAVHNGSLTAIATHGYGLDVFRNGKWINLNLENGLVSNILRKVIHQGKDTLWVAARGGVSRIVFQGDEPVINNIRKTDGLTSEEVYDILIKGHTLFAGTSQGISLIDLEDWVDQNVKPLINMKEILVDGQTRNSETISLKPKSTNLEFRFDGLHYKSQDRVTYLYRMLGLNDQWLPNTSGSVNFGKLGPGEYTFQVKAISAFNNESLVTEQKIIVLSPFWGTWWFLGILLIITALSIYLLTHWIIDRNKKKERLAYDIKLRIAEAERKALQSQLNPHFIFNSLNSIQNMVLKLRAEEAYDYLEKFSALIRRVLEFSERSMIPLYEELNTLRLYMELEQARLDNEFEYSIQIEPEVNQQIEVPTMMIQPYVENAIWHGVMPLNGSRKGKIELKISEVNSLLRIEVEDNGAGRDLRKPLKGKGAQIAKDLAGTTSHKGKASVEIVDLYEDGIARGTKIIIQVLKNIEAYA